LINPRFSARFTEPVFLAGTSMRGVGRAGDGSGEIGGDLAVDQSELMLARFSQPCSLAPRVTP
jgi:hypothetical protein